MRPRRSRPAPLTRSVFAGFCFPSDVIVLAVRWYLRLGLSSRDVEELLSRHTLWSMKSLGGDPQALGDLHGALDLHVQTLAAHGQVFGDDHPPTPGPR
jgi:hypothetical protein